VERLYAQFLAQPTMGGPDAARVHNPMDLFALVPKLSLAMDPELAQIDQLLEDDPLSPGIEIGREFMWTIEHCQRGP
jgi:hypothetical protein